MSASGVFDGALVVVEVVVTYEMDVKVKVVAVLVVVVGAVLVDVVLVDVGEVLVEVVMTAGGPRTRTYELMVVAACTPGVAKSPIAKPISMDDVVLRAGNGSYGEAFASLKGL